MPLARRDPPGRDARVAASAAFDRGIALALRRLPALANQLLSRASSSQPAGGHPPTAAVAKEVHELLARVGDHLRQFINLSPGGAAAASAVLEDAAARAAWLQVVAAVVRWPLTVPSRGSRSEGSRGASSSSGSPGSGSSSSGSGNGGGTGCNQGSTGRGGSTPEAMALLAHEACGTTSALLDLLSAQPPPPAEAPDFVGKLLRMQTLQCLARRFAEAAADAGALTAQQLGLTVCYAQAFGSTIRALAQISIKSGPDQLPLLRLGRQLAEALLDSSVAEHLARLLLLLLLQRPPPTCGVDTTRRMARFTFKICHDISALHCALEGGDQAACAALRQVLSGRCVRHSVLVHVVAALHAADGGPTYGLPDAVRQAALGGCMVEAGQAHPAEHPLQLQWALVSALHAVLLGNDVPLTPVGTRVAVSVLLRFGRLVVASAGGEWAAQQGGLRSVPLPAQPAGPRVVIPLAELAQCAISILPPTLNLLGPLLVAGGPEWVAEAGADCWRLVVAAMSRSLLISASPRQRDWLGTHLLLGWVLQFPPGKPLPSATPPLIVALLEGGLLPRVERLLRRAGEEALGPESGVVEALLRCEHSWQLWCLLLAYSEPRQGGALVVTVGKLLRRVAAGAVAGWASPVTDCVGSMLTRALEFTEAPGQAQAPREQLVRILMCAVCEWLPELSRIALQLMAAQAARGSADEPGRACSVLSPLLIWLPTLLLCCGGGSGGATAGTTTAGGAGAAAGPSAACDSGGWLLQELLGEVRVVPLLGAALRLAQHSTISYPMRLALAETCCLVALSCPDEVRRVPRANAAGAEPQAGGHCSSSDSSTADGAAAAAPLQPNPLQPPRFSSAWPPTLLRALVRHLQKKGGEEQVVDGVLALAELLEAGGEGGGGSSSGGRNAEASRVAFAEARALLRTCSYRGCTCLAGDSEAGARLQACGRCGAAWYCCRACQLSHWHEGGHREACAGGCRPRSDGAEPSRVQEGGL
ncbi:hypothetical protein TSOC_010702 [Tetrabaena socialis]|uniref:phytol kinase n=1 Tax=Tetrabaena socialis TaxID=47790 RepID=A0A2J7ZSN1_9CHLO|nr:hypothetical protein TSOC_010702 [Tetrabaena socialis]|eukprot:PNH03250.1 hypothetical protein TSOC_010702 [Tetrabaena socialis]